MPDGEQTNDGAEQTQETTHTESGGQSGERATFSQDDLNRLVAEERRATERRLRGSDEWKAAQAALRRVKELEDGQKSETERLTARVAELEAERERLANEHREMLLRVAIGAAGAKAGATRPDVLHRLVDGRAVETDDHGDPTNVDAIVAGLKKDYPELFRSAAGSADGGAGGRQPAVSGMNQLIRRAAGRE